MSDARKALEQKISDEGCDGHEGPSGVEECMGTSSFELADVECPDCDGMGGDEANECEKCNGDGSCVPTVEEAKAALLSPTGGSEGGTGP